jgi:hypothetical protein
MEIDGENKTNQFAGGDGNSGIYHSGHRSVDEHRNLEGNDRDGNVDEVNRIDEGTNDGRLIDLELIIKQYRR